MNNTIKLIDSDLKIYNSLEELIIAKFGSLNAFISELNRIDFEKQYVNQELTIDEAKFIFTHDQFNYMRYHIYNPEALSDAIIFQIEEFCKITDYQKTMLKEGLTKKIQEYELGKSDIDTLTLVHLNYYSSMFENVIKSKILEILLYDQECAFLANEYLFRKLSEKAEGMIFRYYKNVKNINDISLIKKLIREDLFSCEK